MTNQSTANASLDLSFQRQLDVPKELIWRAWTRSLLLKRWFFCPNPCQTVACEMDLRSGGVWRTIMHSPLGDWCRPNQVDHLAQKGGAFPIASTHLGGHLGGTAYNASVKHA